MKTISPLVRRRRRFWHATTDCLMPYVDHILHRDQFWAIYTVTFMSKIVEHAVAEQLHQYLEVNVLLPHHQSCLLIADIIRQKRPCYVSSPMS